MNPPSATIDEAGAVNHDEQDVRLEEVAIIGMAVRFPGARNADQFWQNLRDGVESIRDITDAELEATGLSPATYNAPNYVRRSGVLEDIDLFDAAFFGYNPSAAETLDPQHRFFMECAWEALENAGHDPDRFRGAIGVFAGVGSNTYYMMNLFSNPAVMDAMGSFQAQLGNDKDFLATRTSYKLNLKGPSFTLQTACSTSLVATHVACQSLLNGECDMALAGGVTIKVPQKSGYFYSEGGIPSPDGRCRVFDAQARGTVGGSGVGIVVLRRFRDAISDGDHIYAAIKGSAINNDGSMKIGFTAPSLDGQANVIVEAQEVAGVDPGTVTLIEAHGTGTELGDPIEIAALTQAFRIRTDKKQFCYIGSVKSNVGHLDAGAGVAGLIKAALALQHRMIPPTLNFNRPNPKIDFADSPFIVNTVLRPWKSDGSPRRAGVSSFGLGGTNAHVVLEEAHERTAGGWSRPWHLIVLSARTRTALESASGRMADYLRRHPDVHLADVAFTLQVGRRHFRYRRAFTCTAVGDAIKVLESPDGGGTFDAEQDRIDRPVAFLFPGQGEQYPNMTRELYELEPAYRAHVDSCCGLMQRHLGFDLRDVLFPGKQGEEKAREQLRQTYVTQPALFAVEYALARLWMQWGIHPEAMLGHSIGEYVAACISGVCSLEDAVKLVCTRGRLMQQMPGGSMLALFLEEKDVIALLGSDLSLAAVNGPTLSVVSGPHEAVDALQSVLEAKELGFRRLNTAHAFHSSVMDPILERFREEVAGVALRPPEIPFLSNVTGTWITAHEAADPDYWKRQLRETVRFNENLGEIMKNRDVTLLEVGPGNTMSKLARRHPQRGEGHDLVASVRESGEDRSDVGYILESLGKLWLSGASVDWQAFNAGGERFRVALPTYPFEGKRYWIEPRKDARTGVSRRAATAGDGGVSNWLYVPSWKRTAPVHGERDAGTERGERIVQAEHGERDAGTERGVWIVFADGCGFGERFAAKLEANRWSTVTVAPGESFERINERSYRIDPSSRRDYDELLGAVLSGGPKLLGVVHLWSVTARVGQDMSIGEVHAAQHAGFYSLLFLAQALGELGYSEPLRIAAVSNAMQYVAGEERISPLKATILGPCGVIPLEYPHITCTSIDIVLPREGSWQQERLLGQLLVELTAPDHAYVVAYRGNDRWVQAFEQVPLHRAQAVPRMLRDRGVYLITGGLGGVGLVCAEYLARTVNARIVLTDRTEFPGREEWDDWLRTHGDGDGTSGKISKIRDIESLGAEVFVAVADVTDPASMGKVVREAMERFGSLHGVLHAAGTAGGGMIQLRTREHAERVFAPKVSGTLVLDEVLRGIDMDFFIICSSLNSQLPVFGQVDYCAANAFIDAFARYRMLRTGSFTLSVNWDLWREVGMAVETSVPSWLDRMRRGSGHRVIKRPLLDMIVDESSSETIYLTQLSVDRHWVLSEHRIMGNPVIPGTAYLEMAREALEEHVGKSGAIEIRDASFLAPLVVGENETAAVTTKLARSGDGFDFVVTSGSPPADGSDGGRVEHASGSIRYVEEVSPGKIPIRDIGKRCTRSMEGAGEPKQRRSTALVGGFGPRWKNVTAVRVGDGEALAFLDLPRDFVPDLQSFALHPSLLDMATGFANRFAGAGGFLPFWYKRIVMHRSLPARICSHARYREDEGDESGAASFDVTITDEGGNVVVEVESFTMRRVQGFGMFEGRARAESGGHVTAAPSSGAAAGSGASVAARGGGGAHAAGRGMLSVEGVEVFARLLEGTVSPQAVISTTDLESSIEHARAFTQERITGEMEKLEPPRSRHERPSVSTPYVAPRNETEKRLASIWQELIGIDSVGVRDNFFELGGDSVLGLRVVAMANQSGFHISPPQLFENPTIEELAVVAGASAAKEAFDEKARLDGLTAERQPVSTGEQPTPGDFPAAEISQKDLDRLLALLDTNKNGEGS